MRMQCDSYSNATRHIGVENVLEFYVESVLCTCFLSKKLAIGAKKKLVFVLFFYCKDDALLMFQNLKEDGTVTASKR